MDSVTGTRQSQRVGRLQIYVRTVLEPLNRREVKSASHLVVCRSGAGTSF